MRGVWRGGQKWRTMAANARCTSSTWMAGSSSAQSSRRNHGRGAAILQTLVLLGLIDQRDLARFGVAQRGGADDQQLAVADDLPADQRRKLGKGGLHVADSFPEMSLVSSHFPLEQSRQWNDECTEIRSAGQYHCQWVARWGGNCPIFPLASKSGYG